MRIVVRTIYGANLQTALLLGIPFVPVPHSTLNEKFDILKDQIIPDGIMPRLSYYCIGNGGHRVIGGADGIPYTSPINHRASDAGLFNQIPFVMRHTDDDLPTAERNRYALRKLESIEGVEYISYYLKRIDLGSTLMSMQHTSVVDGDSTMTPFMPSTANLNPAHPELPNSGVISTDGNYLSCSAIIPIEFNDRDVQELVNVSNILYQTEQRAIISEIGLCSGIDHITALEGATGMGSPMINEAIAVQISTHITGYYPVGYTSRGFELQIEAGATEPMLGDQFQ